MMNPEYADALKAAFRLQRTMVEVGTGGRVSELNARVTLDQMRDDLATLTGFCDGVEDRLKAAGFVLWSSR